MQSPIPGSSSVAFLSDFTDTPVVATSIVGFRAHIRDLLGYDHSADVDLLGFNVTTSGASPSGFDLDVTETADDAVMPKDVYVRYMACQNLHVGTESPS